MAGVVEASDSGSGSGSERCPSVDFCPVGSPRRRPCLVLGGELVTHVERRRTNLPSDVVVLATRPKVNLAHHPLYRKGGRKSDSQDWQATTPLS